MSDEERSLVQEFNARLKHGEPTDDIKWPEGVTFVKKTHRTYIKGQDHQEEEKTRNGDEKDTKKKKISFHIGNDYNDTDAKSDEA